MKLVDREDPDTLFFDAAYRREAIQRHRDTVIFLFGDTALSPSNKFNQRCKAFTAPPFGMRGEKVGIGRTVLMAVSGLRRRKSRGAAEGFRCLGYEQLGHKKVDYPNYDTTETGN